MVRAGGWSTWAPDWMLGRDLHGATVGIVGGGRIGSAVARRVEGFGCEVLIAGRAGPVDRSPSCSPAPTSSRCTSRSTPRPAA